METIRILQDKLKFGDFVKQIVQSVPVFIQYMALDDELGELDDIEWWVAVIRQLHQDSFCAGPCHIDGREEYLGLLALTVHAKRDRINAIYEFII